MLFLRYLCTWFPCYIYYINWKTHVGIFSQANNFFSIYLFPFQGIEICIYICIQYYICKYVCVCALYIKAVIFVFFEIVFYVLFTFKCKKIYIIRIFFYKKYKTFLFQDCHRPYSPADSHSPATLSPLHFKDIDEPRKRAPRALTGRYVRTGTAASPRVLQLLRKKVEERLRLKEMLSNGGPHGIDKRAAFFSGFN